ncbi:MAG: hypothetical protein JSS49_27470 [Planctomycetes bacterium]|nr:hypothetical protein [Planctomycetota bacterium]
MADLFTTLADLVKLNDMNLADINVSDLLQEAPLLAALASTTASNGTNHSYLKETAAPVVGFRAVNAGRFNSASASVKVDVSLEIMDASFAVDKALADAYGKGGAPAFVALEGVKALRESFKGIEKEIFYGTSYDASGFVGLSQAETVDALADTDHVVDAQGTTVNGASSVWLLRSVGDESGVTMVTGKDGQIEIGDTVVQRLTDNSGKSYPAYYTPISGWYGLQYGGIYDVVRIVNLTTQADKGLTDDLLAQAIELFAGKLPTHIAMNPQSRRQLQQSRTSFSPTGAPVPLPTEFEGVPIIVTNQLSKTEPLVA